MTTLATLSGRDIARLVVAVLILAAGVTSWWLLQEAFFPLRMLAVIAAVALAALVAWTTRPGARAVGFTQEVQVEVRKVVWPGRPQTVQMTGMVLAMVTVVALLLWLLDWLLGELVGWLIY